MSSPVKNLTLIGLILEGFSLIVLGFIVILSYQPWVIDLLMIEFADVFNWFELIRGFLTLFSVIALVFFSINLVLFGPIIKGKVSQKTGAILLYQAVYGAINLAFNQLVGIIYLISGVIGTNQIEKNNNPVREGL